MKKKLIAALLALASACCLSFGLAACNEKAPEINNGAQQYAPSIDDNKTPEEKPSNSDGDKTPEEEPGNSDNGKEDDKLVHKHEYNQENATDLYKKSGVTCTAPATYYYSCSCGEKGTLTFEYGDATGHTEETITGTPATCTETGLTDGVKCSVCQEILTEQSIILAIGTHVLENEVCIYCNNTIVDLADAYYDMSKDSDGSITGYLLPRDDGNYDCYIMGSGEMRDYTYSNAPFYANSYSSKIATLEISEDITYIGNNAFRNCTSLTGITIPESVTSIGGAAFYNCSLLTNITIPNSVTSIGSSAFYKCSSLTSITIPNNVTSIGSSAFEYCSSLTSITIPESVTSIGSSAFRDCSALTSIVIPDSVTSIGIYAFYGCSSLEYNEYDNAKYLGNSGNPYHALIEVQSTSITSCAINTDTKVIAVGVFYNCRSLESITVEENDANYKSIDGNLYNKNGTILLIYAIGKTATIFTIPDGVTSIGDRAFDECRSLESITIANSVTNIGNSAFSGCSSLTSITIPNSVTIIGTYAFYSCDKLTSVTIPNSVTSIGNSAFAGCRSLTIYCEATSQSSGWDSSWNYSNCPVVWNCNNNDKDENGYAYTVVDGVRYSLKDNIATVVAQPINITTANISSSVTYKNQTYSVTSIGEDAFHNCYSLTSITIPNSVTSIGDYAFIYCHSLTSITIPNSVTSIGDNAFYNCGLLTSITIPNSVTSIGEDAFYLCYSLTSINFGGTVEQWNSIEKVSNWNAYTGNYTIHYTDGDVEKS